MSNLSPDVFRCMIQEADFRTLCSDPTVALCKAPSEPFNAEVTCHGMLPSVPSCAACKFAISGLQQYVNDTSTRMVQSIGTDICRFHFSRNDMAQMVRARRLFRPAPCRARADRARAPQCRVVMTSFGDVMLRVLASRVDSEDFCCELGLCDLPVKREGERWTDLSPKPETA